MISTLCKYKFSLKYIQTAFAFCTTLRRAYLADLMISTLLQAQFCQSWLLWQFANLNLEFKSNSRATLNLWRTLQHWSILVISISSSISRTHQHWSILVISFQILTHHSLSSPFQLPLSYLSRPFVESLTPPFKPVVWSSQRKWYAQMVTGEYQMKQDYLFRVFS